MHCAYSLSRLENQLLLHICPGIGGINPYHSETDISVALRPPPHDIRFLTTASITVRVPATSFDYI